MSIDRENMPDFLVRLRDAPRFSHGFAGWSGAFEDWRAAGLGLLRAAVGPALDGEAAVEEVSRGEDGGRAAPPSPRGLPDRRRRPRR